MKSFQEVHNLSIKILNEAVLLETSREGLLNLPVKFGMETLGQMLEADVTELVGEKGKHNSQRTANRHGIEHTKVILGGENRGILEPRVCSNDGKKLNR